MASKGSERKYGRCARKPAKVRYRNSNRRDRNKGKKVMQSNGEAGFKAWKAGYGGSMPRTKRNLPASHYKKVDK